MKNEKKRFHSLEIDKNETAFREMYYLFLSN